MHTLQPRIVTHPAAKCFGCRELSFSQGDFIYRLDHVGAPVYGPRTRLLRPKAF